MIKYPTIITLLISIFTITASDTAITIQCKPLPISKVLPQVTESDIAVVWFSGRNGLTKSGGEFYRDQVFKKSKKKSCIWGLYLMKAWNCLYDKNTDTTDPYADKIIHQDPVRYRALDSTYFFNWLREKHNQNFIENVLSYSKIFNISCNRKPSGITVGDVFPSLEAWEKYRDMDTAQIYSALQYLEFLYLSMECSRIVQEKKSDSTISFLLPNDEYKYYVGTTDPDEESIAQFQHTAAFDITSLCTLNGIRPPSSVNIYTFIYGDGKIGRPYLSSKQDFIAPTDIVQYLP